MKTEYYPCTVFLPPYGTRDTMDIPLDPVTYWTFKRMGAKLSSEVLGTGEYVLYLDVGLVDEEGTPQEIVSIVSGPVQSAHWVALLTDAQRALDAES